MTGRRSRACLAERAAQCAALWQLELGDPFPDASNSLALAACLPNGTEAVLKLQVPHRKAEHEAAALERWDGDGAVRLLAHDRQRHALLLERCRPGTPLSALDQDAALEVLIDLLPRLWRPAAPPFTSLADEATHWAVTLPHAWEQAGRPFERPLLDAMLEAIDELAGTQGEQVLVHQDLHADNVLRARREPWLAIDPKPLTGEREFALGPIIRGSELGHGRANLLHRLDTLTEALHLDRRRAAGWAFVQTLAWSIDVTHVWPEMAEIARWLDEQMR